MSIIRREALSFLGVSTALLTIGLGGHAFAGTTRQEIPKWIGRIDELTAMLRGEVITISDWRAGLEQLFNQIELADILRDIDFNRLKEAAGFARLGVSTVRIDFGNGAVRRLAFYPKFFAVDKGRAIIPHGHSNMISAHLTLGGRFHLRQYDQLARDAKTMLVRKSFEGTIVAGDISSIAEVSDNVHWFIAEQRAHTLDVVVTGLDSTSTPDYDIFNLDMDGAIVEGDGLRVPRLGVREALHKYG